MLHKHAGSALVFPQAPSQSCPRSELATGGCRDCTAAWATLQITLELNLTGTTLTRRRAEH